MKIIILEDLKHFRKQVEVYSFPPIYKIPQMRPIEVYPDFLLGDNMDKFSDTISFYPFGKSNNDTRSYYLAI